MIVRSTFTALEPWAGSVALSTVKASPSRSVSFAKTTTDLAKSSAVVVVSSLAEGASLRAVTVIVNVWTGLVSTPPLAVPPSS